MKIRVGRKTHSFCPTLPDYETVIVTVKRDSPWFPLGPYYLKDENGYIFENIWQFHKVYRHVNEALSGYSQWLRMMIVWRHPAETHVNEEGDILPEYFLWRKKGLTNMAPVRWPQWHVQRDKYCYKSQQKPLYCFYNGEKLGYIEARKKVYLPEYIRLVKQHPLYQKLKEMSKHHNLLIVEWDGPHQESMEYYKKKYNVTDDFIVDSTMNATAENIDLMLNDEKHPFGHGYCLAAALLAED